MGKLGIVGGLGPASTIEYYRGIVERYRTVKGDDCYPEIVIDSMNMGKLIRAISAREYTGAAEQLLESIAHLEQAGASFAAIASNSPHIVWDLICDKTGISLVSIIDATCDKIIRQGYGKVLIFATKFTMKNGLYSNALSQRKIDWILPEDADIETLGDIIYPNLENGIVLETEKERMICIAERYIKELGADALLLGCTEIPLMIRTGDVSVPIINTTEIHIEKLSGLLLQE